MPLTEKGKEIKSAMEKQYGPEKGESVFYASKNKGTITGVDDQAQKMKLEHAPPFETATQSVTGTYPGIDAASVPLPAGEPKQAPTAPSGLPNVITQAETVAAAMARWNSGRG